MSTLRESKSQSRQRSLTRRSLQRVVWRLCGLAFAGRAHQETVQDKVVVITEASSGFGKGVARKLAGQGSVIYQSQHHVAVLPRGESVDLPPSNKVRRRGIDAANCPVTEPEKGPLLPCRYRSRNFAAKSLSSLGPPPVSV
jgi:hypothetical protein